MRWLISINPGGVSTTGYAVSSQIIMDLSHVTNAKGVFEASLGLPLEAATPGRPPIPVLNHKVVPEATAIAG